MRATLTLLMIVVQSLACGGPIRVEAPEVVKGMQDLGAKLDTTGSKYLVEQATAARDEAKALEAANRELVLARDKAQAGLAAPYELELECDANPSSQSEITTSLDGVRGSSVSCPSKNRPISLQQWTPGAGRLHVELHVASDTAGYNSFTVRLWHNGQTVWTVARANPMTKTEGCKSMPDHRIECAFDDPFPLEAGHAGKVRTIDR